MDGSAWVAVSGIAAGLAGTIFTQVYQRRGERERAATAREERREEQRQERWLETRREVYLRFLAGSDDCIEHSRARYHYLRYGFDADAPNPPPDQADPDRDRALAVAPGLEECTDALAHLRLFAPADVVRAASEFVALTREIEHFEGMEAALLPHDRDRLKAWRANPEPNLSEDARRRASEKLLAAMRRDLGADESDVAPVGVSATIYGC